MIGIDSALRPSPILADVDRPLGAGVPRRCRPRPARGRPQLARPAGPAVCSACSCSPPARPTCATPSRPRRCSWLQARHEARVQTAAGGDAEPDLGEPDAIARATASDPKDLSRAQAAVAYWLARRYHVAPEPVSRLVQEAWTVGALVNLDPTLILAVMAVESSFNPFAQSPVGAQGLMQVMTKVHDDKYEAFGGSHAAFDPVTNLRVGVQVLKECIARSGGLEAGLRSYVGAANSGEDGGYADKVLAEQSILRQVAGGARVAITAAVGRAGAAEAGGRARAPRPRSRHRPPLRPQRPRRTTRSPCSTDAGSARPLPCTLRYTGSAVRLAMRLPTGARGGSPPGSTVGTCVARVGQPFAWAAPRAVAFDSRGLP